jgi:hypothetical protein
MNVENVRTLIITLQDVKPKKFNMGDKGFYRKNHERSAFDLHQCGTAGCISGWIGQIAFSDPQVDTDSTADWLGIDWEDGFKLFLPPGYQGEIDTKRKYRTYPLSRALDTLRFMLFMYERDGEIVIDWDAPHSPPLHREPVPALV